MAASQLCDFSLLAHGHPQAPSYETSSSQYRADAAVENRARGITCAETRAAASLDPFTSYKTYLDTNLPMLELQENFKSDNDGYTCQSGAATTLNTLVDDAQPQARGHTAAYKLAVRLASRSFGAPLATIIEQGSYSTLNSHGSLLSVGRFPSLKPGENTSPNQGSRRQSHSLDEKALHDIQEDLAREQNIPVVPVPQSRLDKEHGVADSTSGTTTPLTSYRFELQRSPSIQSGDQLSEDDTKGVKGFIRGVFHHVRGVSRSRSRSSSMTHTPIMERQKGSPSPGESSPQPNQQGWGSEFNHAQKHKQDMSSRTSEGAATPPLLADQTRNHAISVPGVDSSARVYPPSTKSRSALTESTTVFGSVPPLLPYRAATSLHDRPFSSTPVVRPGTRDVARENGTTQASAPRHDMFDTSARYTFDGVPVYRGCPSLLKEASSAREVFASQNSSFCSSMSTSYSGTVLGIDLDLQHDFSHPVRRSQSPPTPVWFTPQMAELERQASFSESSESVKAYTQAHTQCRSINSPALTSLLPIAAASGIVRPIYDTPKISFYSPSGNLIQPESSSIRGTSPSEYEDSATVTTSYYNKQNTNAALPPRSLAFRPPLKPMTTPPTHRTPLPPHLRHHNDHHPEKSQISSHESSITPKAPVKGCDGVVRENSLTPHSGVFYPHEKDRIHRSAKMIMRDLKAQAEFYKSRFIALAAAQSFAPSMPKGRNVQKGPVHSYNTYAKKPHAQATSTERGRKGGYREDVLGPFAAHALRICFCQPYDGAGKPTRVTSAGACMTGEPFPAKGKPGVDQDAKNVEHSLPNARVVDSGTRSRGGTKRAEKRDSALSGTSQRFRKAVVAKKMVD